MTSRKSKSKSKSKSKLPTQIFYNKYVLYGLFFLSILNVLKLLHYNQLKAISIFFIAGAFFSFFTKNMIIIMGASIIISSIYSMTQHRLRHKGKSWKSVYEGMENEDHGEEHGEEHDEEHDEEHGEEHGEEQDKKVLKEGVRGCKGKPCKIRPKALNDEDEVDKDYIDKSSTIENSFAQYEKLLGPNAMNKLSEETTKLMKRQKTLLKQMKNATPAIENMQTMINNLKDEDLKSIKNKFSNIMSSIKND